MGQSTRTILVVDDSPEDRELYRRYLLRDRTYHYNVLEASLGRQGLELWQQHQPDAVLLDYRLPDLNGLEFLARLQALLQQSELPAIVVTGQGSEAIAVQAMKAGAQDYLVKEQLNPESLRVALNSTITNVGLRHRLQQSEEALQQSEERFRHILESSSDCIKLLDLDGRILYMNPGGLCLMEIDDFSLYLNANWFCFWQENDRTVAKAAIATAKAGEVSRFQGFCPTAKGTPKWWDVVVTPIFDSGKQVIQLLATSRDITEQKYAEQERDRFFQLSRDMLAICNTDGYFLQVSAAWTETLGYTTQELTTQPYLEFVHPDDQAATIAEAQKVAQGLFTVTFENRYRCRDGSYRWFAWSAAAAIEQGLLYCVARDVTQQKQAEAEWNRLLEREQSARETAEAANRVKDEFLAVLSHELRTPMNPIVGWASLLKQGKLNPTKTTEAIAIIDRNAKLQVQLIDDLLDISRILQGKLTLNRFPVDLKFVIHAAIETVRLAADAKAIALQTQLASVDCVNGDAGRLQQVVWNLLSNAVKFTDHGGKITITLATVGTIAQIQVRDTGKGIQPDFLPHVFEHFRQEDGATTRKFGGLGLGLAIARQIIEMHGGRISVESLGEGQGATFTVQLPLASQATPSVPSQPLSDSNLNLSNLHILVVDDEPDSRDFVAFMLEQTGAIVTSVASGIEALQAIERSVPDLIVSDIGMPEMDGYSLIQQIRALPAEKGGQVAAIALTAYAREEDQRQAMLNGYQSHMTKPIDLEQFVQAIAALCSTNTRIGMLVHYCS